MPVDTTHLHLSALLLADMSGIDAYAFCLGSIAPDCAGSSDQRAFQTAHNLVNSGRFDYFGFYADQRAGRPEQDFPARSYILGYFSHLWFDEFAKNAEAAIPNALPGKRPANRQLIRSEIARLDRTAVLDMSASIVVSSAPSELPVIGGIDPALPAEKYETTVARLKRLQGGPQTDRFISASAYSDFLDSAKSGFRRCLEAL